MTDDDIRALVRLAVERHLGAASPEQPAATPAPAVHPSAARYHLPRASDDSMCLIEPAVRCNHCGYCQCHGH